MTAVQAKPRTLHWMALMLLVISVCINYADRGSLGVAAKSIESELHFSPEQLGRMLASFYLTYSFFQLVAGKLIDRWNVNWVYAAGFLIWSAATGLTGLISSFGALFAVRFVLGAGEAVAYPAYSKIIAAVFPENLRGTANALIDAGSKAGPALGVFIGVKLLNRFTWRGMFIVIAIASFVWLIPWCATIPKLKVRHLEEGESWSPSYLELIRHRGLWGTVIGLFCANYVWYFLLNWVPYYLENERHYTKDRLAFFASLPFWGVAGASLLFGLLADFFIRRGYEPGRVRQTIITVGLVACCAFLLPAALVQDHVLFTSLFFLAFVSMAGFSSNHWALSQRLAGLDAAGKWTGFQNCLGNLAGYATNEITGRLLAGTHSFLPAFVVACCVLLVSAGGYWLVVGRPVPIRWYVSEIAYEEGRKNLFR